MDLALDGMTVVDISQGVPGPLCSTMLGDLGAEVIKLEPPGGDWLRTVGPFTESESDLFIRLNRNKKGAMRQPERPGRPGHCPASGPGRRRVHRGLYDWGGRASGAVVRRAVRA